MFRSQPQTRFWLLALIIFVLALWLLKPVLLPFVAGMIIAYFLNPAVNILWRQRVPRWLGTFIVLLAFGIGVTLIVILIFPLLQDQIGALIDAIPGYIGKIRAYYIPWVESWLARFAPEDIEKLQSAAGQSVTQAAGWAAKLVQQVVSGGFALIDLLALAIIMPVVAFYMLRDWPRLVGTIDMLIPRRHYMVVQEQLNEIDNTLSGFIRGQALVCLALGLMYSVGLTLVGLDYAVAIGVTAGVLSFIPYVGTAFGWLTSFLLALVQFDDWMHIGLVIGVFVVGNILEGNFLTPRLVGRRVGLHPVWVLFALLAGGKLMGFTGVLIAVPTAAVIGVLTRFAIGQYKNSSLYKDPLAPTKP